MNKLQALNFYKRNLHKNRFYSLLLSSSIGKAYPLK